MNPTLITVPSKSGAQGDSIENFVLDRVSGDVEKNMGLVIEHALQGSSIPVAFALVLSGAEQLRRAFIVASDSVPSGMKDASKINRDGVIKLSAELNLLEEDLTDVVILELADPASTLKSKAWSMAGLTQTASTSGTSGNSAIDALFVPSVKTYTLAALIAKLEDLALSNDHVIVYGNQAFPEIYVMINNGGTLDVTGVPDWIGSPVLAQINGVFVAESGESNPNFGFESGGGF